MSKFPKDLIVCEDQNGTKWRVKMDPGKLLQRNANIALCQPQWAIGYIS